MSDILFDRAARESLAKGVNALGDAVQVTLGPKGRNAAIQKGHGPPLITKDGVTVARSISLSDPAENMGADLIKSVASSANALAGDGTTTATVLAAAVFNSASKLIEAKFNPILLKRGLDKALAISINRLKELSSPITSADEVKAIATISANNDPEIGSLIAEAVLAVGKGGSISIEDSTSTETKVVYSEGVEIDRGYLTQHFINNFQKMTAEMDNPLMLFCDFELLKIDELMPVLNMIHSAQKQLVIIAKNIDGEVLNTLIVNRAKEIIKCIPIKAPGFGDIRKDLMEDLAIMTGGFLFEESSRSLLLNPKPEHFGIAERVVAYKNTSQIIAGNKHKEAVLKRVAALEEQLKQDLDTYQIASIKQRIASLSNAVAVIKVGGLSEAEVKEKRDRIEDAVNAVRSAIDEGILPGGGSSLLRCIPVLEKELKKSYLTPEEKEGFSIMIAALKRPFIAIMENAGVESHSLLMEKIMRSKGAVGYDALRMVEVKDMLKAGIVDPLKVARSSLETAVSAAGTLMTTSVIIFAEKKV